MAIIVEPGEGDSEDDTTASLVDPNEKRMPFYIILTVFIVIDIILALAILRYSSRKKSKQQGDYDKGEALEGEKQK